MKVSFVRVNRSILFMNLRINVPPRSKKNRYTNQSLKFKYGSIEIIVPTKDETKQKKKKVVL